MSEEKDVTPPKEEPSQLESDKIRNQFGQVCAQIGECVHRLELLKNDQMELQAAWLEALEKEKVKA